MVLFLQQAVKNSRQKGYKKDKAEMFGSNGYRTAVAASVMLSDGVGINYGASVQFL